MNTLNEHCLEHIAHLLYTLAARRALALTCRRAAYVIGAQKSKYVWSKTQITARGHEQPSALPPALLAGRHLVLRLRRCPWLTATAVAGFVTRRVVAIHAITLYACDNLTTLPAVLGRCYALAVQSCSGLRGALPPALGRCHDLTIHSCLDIPGSIPAAFGGCYTLSIINCPSIVGAIPAALGACHAIHLSCFSIGGSIPTELGKCHTVKLVDCLLLRGSIPDGLGTCHTLEISHSGVSGDIPAALGTCHAVTLRCASLSGNIPATLRACAVLIIERGRYLFNTHFDELANCRGRTITRMRR
jgi:hypothetical protein